MKFSNINFFFLLQKITVEIVDDNVFEEDEYFYLHLNNLRVRTNDGLILDSLNFGSVPLATLELPSTATVMILGLFQ